VSLGGGQILDLLSHLVDKSLAVYEEDENGQGRYRLLETVRQYARGRLMESGEGEAVRRRHRDHFLRLAEEVAPYSIWYIGREAPGAWTERLRQDHDNLRAALEWSKAEPDEEKGTRAGLRLALTLSAFWYRTGGSFVSEGRQHLADLLGRVGAAGLERTPELARAHEAAGLLAHLQGDHAAARAHLQETLAIWQERGEEGQGDWARYFLAYAAEAGGNYRAARALCEEALAGFRARGDERGTARALHGLGRIAEFTGEYPRARGLYEQALALYRKTHWLLDVAWTLHGIGFLACREGDLDIARLRLVESLGMFREVGDDVGLLRSLERFAVLAAAYGQRERDPVRLMRAARLFGAAQGLREAFSMPLALPGQQGQAPDIEAVRAALGEEAFAAAWEQGRSMSLEQAIAYALEETPALTA
jgi:non-specific serine/threonine protein kinase